MNDFDSHTTNPSSCRASDLMSLEEDKNLIEILSETIVRSISEAIASILCIKLECESILDFACYLERTTPVIMELQVSRDIPSNAIEILQSVSTSVDRAKHLIEKCLATVHCISDPALRSIIQEFTTVVREIGMSLSLIPSSIFKDQEYVDIAVRALSKEMQNAHIRITQDPSQELQKPNLSELQEERELTEMDLYPVRVEYLPDGPCSSDEPELDKSLEEISYIGEQDHESSGARTLKPLPEVAGYMEPIYEAFFCPLTKKIMDDPVTVSSGVTYERRVIEKWLKKSNDSSEDVLCPVTGKKLMTRVLNTNVALQKTIEAWKERNEIMRIKVARTALSLASSDSMILEALKDLQNICQMKQYNKVQVVNSGMIPLLAQCLESNDKKVRHATLEILQVIAAENDDGKEIIAKTKAIPTTVRMLSSKNLKERHASLSFLQELSVSEALCEKIGSVTGLILMLITMKFNRSSDSSSLEKVNKILQNLERSPMNIKRMAGNGFLEPLLKHLIEGSEETQMEMGSYLGKIVLGHETKTYVAERASPTLIKMVHSESSLARKAAFEALVQISSYHPNSRTLVEAGTIPVIIEEMFIHSNNNELTNSSEESAAILANILDSGIPLESLEVNTRGHTLGSKYVVYSLIQLLKKSSSDTLNINLINILLCLMKSSKATAVVVSVVKETEASNTLIELINYPHEELSIATVKLLITLTPKMGHTIADRLCKSRGQPEGLIKSPVEAHRITEKHAVSANFLAKLPLQNLPLNLALLHKEIVPKVLQTIGEIQKASTRASRFANAYLEGLVGILVRFSTTLYEPQILHLARHHNFAVVFTELLMRTASDEVQRLAAIGLENLSAESLNLSKPPQLKTTKMSKLRRFLSVKSSKSRELMQVCPVHRGVCSSQTTFCLLDAKAVERLLACLHNENDQVVGAALSAICTLLDEKVDVDKSVSVLSEANAVEHVLNVLREHRQDSVQQKSFWMIEKFLMKGGDASASDISQDRLLSSSLVTALHYGDVNTRQIAEKILRHLNKLPNSTKF